MQLLSVADLLCVTSMPFYLEMEPSAFYGDGRWGLSSDKKADGERQIYEQ